ncbi:MAG: hypothetical protein AAGI53_06290 [Planctomycetota bacterium]
MTTAPDVAADIGSIRERQAEAMKHLRTVHLLLVGACLTAVLSVSVDPTTRIAGARTFVSAMRQVLNPPTDHFAPGIFGEAVPGEDYVRFIFVPDGDAKRYLPGDGIAVPPLLVFEVGGELRESFTDGEATIQECVRFAASLSTLKGVPRAPLSEMIIVGHADDPTGPSLEPELVGRQLGKLRLARPGELSNRGAYYDLEPDDITVRRESNRLAASANIEGTSVVAVWACGATNDQPFPGDFDELDLATSSRIMSDVRSFLIYEGEDIPISELERRISDASASAGRVKILGFELPPGTPIRPIFVTVICGLQLYLVSHVLTLSRDASDHGIDRRFPWVGVSGGVLGLGISFVISCAIPTAAIIASNPGNGAWLGAIAVPLIHFFALWNLRINTSGFSETTRGWARWALPLLG